MGACGAAAAIHAGAAVAAVRPGASSGAPAAVSPSPAALVPRNPRCVHRLDPPECPECC
jgi:hypothetical protein